MAGVNSLPYWPLGVAPAPAFPACGCSGSRGTSRRRPSDAWRACRNGGAACRSGGNRYAPSSSASPASTARSSSSIEASTCPKAGSSSGRCATPRRDEAARIFVPSTPCSRVLRQTPTGASLQSRHRLRPWLGRPALDERRACLAPAISSLKTKWVG